MSEKKTLFSAKYPAFERNWKKKKIEEKVKTTESAQVITTTEKSALPVAKVDHSVITRDLQKETTGNQLEQAMEELFKDKENETCAKTSHTSARKRIRKLPKR